jgi:hypothetical protein
VRHLPVNGSGATGWFAVDDLLVENCPIGEFVVFCVYRIVSVRLVSKRRTTTTTMTLNESETTTIESTTFNISQWRTEEIRHDDTVTATSGQDLLTLILYLLCALIAMTLLIILLTIIIYTYRKHCCPFHHRHQTIFEKIATHNRIGIQIEADQRSDKPLDTNIRPCFE